MFGRAWHADHAGIVPPGGGGVRLACVRGLLFNALGAATVIFNFSMFNYFNVRLFWVANSSVRWLFVLQL